MSDESEVARSPVTGRPVTPHGNELEREATTMVIYVSLVLLATMVALSSSDDSQHGTEGAHGAALIGVIWGTAIGLAVAHWFAFRITALAFGGGRASKTDVKIGLAQLGASAAVAVVCSIPVLIFDETNDVQAVGFVPAVIIGVAGYVLARAAHRRQLPSIAIGFGVMLVGLAVAGVTNVLEGH